MIDLHKVRLLAATTYLSHVWQATLLALADESSNDLLQHRDASKAKRHSVGGLLIMRKYLIQLNYKFRQTYKPSIRSQIMQSDRKNDR